jgi:hypothetical protein
MVPSNFAPLRHRRVEDRMTRQPAPTSDGDVLPSAPEKLVYADIEPPEPGRVTPIGGGVHWLRMPLLGELGHINLWLIEHDGGFVVVDTGMATSEGREVWESLCETVLKERPIKLIVVTHLHPDHIGLAAWLQERVDAPVWTSRLSYEQVRDLLTPTPQDEITERVRFLVSHGIANTQELAQMLRWLGAARRGGSLKSVGMPQVIFVCMRRN